MSVRAVSLQTPTSCSLPQGPEALLPHDLPEAVDDPVVGGLSRPGRHLQARLDDISGRHQGGGGDTWEQRRSGDAHCWVTGPGAEPAPGPISTDAGWKPELTCDGAGCKELQRSQVALLVSKAGLEVGVGREVNGREGDVSEEAGLSTLHRKL